MPSASKYIESGKSLTGETILDAVSKAVATNEVNAAWARSVPHRLQVLPVSYPVRCFAVKKQIEPYEGRDDPFLIHFRSIWFGRGE